MQNERIRTEVGPIGKSEERHPVIGEPAGSR